MKKIILFLVIFTISCIFLSYKNIDNSKDYVITNFSYNGHNYMKFKEKECFSIIHNPDCNNSKCKK